MSYEVLARKYRPINFEEVIGQDQIIKALVNSINQDKLHQAFIFSGTRGVGKTTIARILAKCLNCESDSRPTPRPCNECSNTKEITEGRSLDFLEIDAASNTQVDKIRDLLESVRYKPAKSRYKVYLIDEVHMLSPASFNALLKTLEEPPSHVVFIFATTNPDKIPKTVQSRCLQLNLKTVNKELLSEHLKKILKKEKITFDDESVSMIANSAKGSVRDALTLLDQAVAHGNGELKEDQVSKLLGTIDDSFLIDLINGVIEGDGNQVFKTFYAIEELSPEYDTILKDMITMLHQISLEQHLQNSEIDHIKETAAKIDKEFCQLLYEIAMNSYSKFSVHPNPKEAIEICLLRMLTFNPLHKLSENPSTKTTKEEKKNLKKETPKTLNISSKKPGTSNKLINSNDVWVNFFSSNSEKMSPFVINYFGYMSFKSFDDDSITLIVDSKRQGLDAPENIPKNILLEFESILKDFLSKEIKVNFEIGNVINSPLEIEAVKNKEKYNKAEKNIKNNKSIQNFMKKFDGKIKEESIKPTS
tara:strand:+ start:2785 stop:4380 length:1596 start_codon:yes stop_codon:yes gene_type:complete